MSNYESERGDITLPSAAVAPLKVELRTVMNTFHEDVRKRATDLHKGFGTRSVKKYGEALRESQKVEESHIRDWRFRSIPTEKQVYQRRVNDAAAHVLYRILDRARYGDTIKMPTVKDIDKIAPKVTNRDNVFPLISNQGSIIGAISFNGRIVTWDVANNNHAVENARESIPAQAFFGYLQGVKWTARTGGVISYHSEYHEDSQDALSFGGTISGYYGPVGEKYHEARAKAQVAMARAMM